MTGGPHVIITWQISLEQTKMDPGPVKDGLSHPGQLSAYGPYVLRIWIFGSSDVTELKAVKMLETCRPSVGCALKSVESAFVHATKSPLLAEASSSSSPPSPSLPLLGPLGWGPLMKVDRAFRRTGPALQRSHVHSAFLRGIRSLQGGLQ